MEGAALTEARMRVSGLFKQVGFEQMGQLFPELMAYVTGHLPVLFSEDDLEKVVKPLLAPEKVRETLRARVSSLQDLNGIGQTGFIADDPLELRNQILARLSSLAPAKGARIENGRLVSADGCHILIVAEPAEPGMDTRYAGRIAALMEGISKELAGKYAAKGGLTVTPVGAYRAALDNETSAKENVRKAVLFSTAAIILLLLVGFPRPLIGLLSLLPAFAGTMMAYFVYSLFHRTISLMAVGFGGAIISFTVDYGITYLLFLDRPYKTRGMEATKEVWSLGLLAMLTTAISFAALSFSGFPALVEIGQFAALGVVFTYIFVHAVFPLIFPVVAPAKRSPVLPLQRFVNRLASARGMWKVYAALAFAVVMAFFAKPDARLDLQAMNSVSRETLNAEKMIRDAWGDVGTKVHILVEGRDRADLQRKCDRLASLIDRERSAGVISQAFVSSMIFPGSELAREHQAAWRSFWTPERIAGLKTAMEGPAEEVGFAAGAFAPFFRQLSEADLPETAMPEKYFPLLGIKAGTDGSQWTQIVTVTPGPSYRGEDFYRKLSASGLAKVFDPALFTDRLGSLLSSAFVKMAVIVGLITLLTAFQYFLDWRLTLLGTVPTLFALICTLGTLNLLGEPLSIPTIMVSVVVIGMGTDYALYLVRAHQRYLDEDDPSLGLIRLSVFLSFSTTFLGFGVLALSDNAVLKSAGMGLALGIGYSFLGAVMIVPPLLKKVFAPSVRKEEVEALCAGSKRHTARVMDRYRHMESYPRIFARFKILLDPMFPKLAAFVEDPRVIIDIGTGYGIPATWLLELHPHARVYGIEPDGRRVRIASRVVGSQGRVVVGAAPDLSDVPEAVDTALVLDMIHMLTDEALGLTLRRLREKMAPGGTLVLRTTIPSAMRVPWKRWIETARVEAYGAFFRFRTEDEVRAALTEAGFELIKTEPSAPDCEELWFIARAGLSVADPDAATSLSGEPL